MEVCIIMWSGVMSTTLSAGTWARDINNTPKSCVVSIDVNIEGPISDLKLE